MFMTGNERRIPDQLFFRKICLLRSCAPLNGRGGLIIVILPLSHLTCTPTMKPHLILIALFVWFGASQEEALARAGFHPVDRFDPYRDPRDPSQRPGSPWDVRYRVIDHDPYDRGVRRVVYVEPRD